MSRAAERSRAEFETTGVKAVLTLRLKPRLEDLPEHVLDETLWLNKVGTFGVASAGYWWGRLGVASVHLCGLVFGFDLLLWVLLFCR